MAPMRNDDNLILQKIEEISRKQDRIPDLISDVERRQRADLDTLRRDFERMFVSHAEYDPKHQVLIDKVKEYDQVIASGRTRQEEYVRVKNTVEDHDRELVGVKSEIKAIREHSAGLPTRVLPWLALAGSLAAVLLNYAQHIVIR